MTTPDSLTAIVDGISKLTAHGAASVLIYEVPDAVDGEPVAVVVNRVQPPLLEYFWGATLAKAIAKAVMWAEPMPSPEEPT